MSPSHDIRRLLLISKLLVNECESLIETNDLDVNEVKRIIEYLQKSMTLVKKSSSSSTTSSSTASTAPTTHDTDMGNASESSIDSDIDSSNESDLGYGLTGFCRKCKRSYNFCELCQKHGCVHVSCHCPSKSYSPKSSECSSESDSDSDSYSDGEEAQRPLDMAPKLKSVKRKNLNLDKNGSKKFKHIW